MKFNYISFLKIIITFSFLLFIWFKIDIDEILKLLNLLSYTDWVFMLLVITLVNFLAVYRWQLISNNLEIYLPFKAYIKFFYLGNFLNQVIPTSAIGDGFRLWSIYKNGYGFKVSLHSIIFDRIIPLTSILVIIVFTLYPLVLITNQVIIFYFFLLMIAFIVFIFFLLKFLLKITDKLSRFYMLTKILQFLQELYISFKLQLRSMLPLALGVIGFCIMVFMVTYIAQKMEIKLDFWTALILIPPVFIAMSIPISLAGWGTREYSMVIALGFVGISSEQAISISIALGLIILLGSFPALLFSKYLFKNIKDL